MKKILTKKQEKEILTRVDSWLGAEPAMADADDIDTCDFTLAEEYGVDEDTIRYVADLPR